MEPYLAEDGAGLRIEDAQDVVAAQREQTMRVDGEREDVRHPFVDLEAEHLRQKNRHVLAFAERQVRARLRVETADAHAGGVPVVWYDEHILVVPSHGRRPALLAPRLASVGPYRERTVSAFREVAAENRHLASRPHRLDRVVVRAPSAAVVQGVPRGRAGIVEAELPVSVDPVRADRLRYVPAGRRRPAGFVKPIPADFHFSLSVLLADLVVIGSESAREVAHAAPFGVVDHEREELAPRRDGRTDGDRPLRLDDRRTVFTRFRGSCEEMHVAPGLLRAPEELARVDAGLEVVLVVVHREARARRCAPVELEAHAVDVSRLGAVLFVGVYYAPRDLHLLREALPVVGHPVRELHALAELCHSVLPGIEQPLYVLDVLVLGVLSVARLDILERRLAAPVEAPHREPCDHRVGTRPELHGVRRPSAPGVALRIDLRV